MIKHLPNAISAIRILAAPILIALAWLQYEKGYLYLLIFAMLSDAVDGYLARKLAAQTELGAKLDSLGDMAIYLTVPFGALWLVPEIVQEILPYVVTVVAAYLTPIVASLAKFKKIASLHTWLAKASGVVISIATVLIFANGNTMLFKVAAVIQAVVAIEYLAILWRLPKLKSNVKSVFHVYKK